MVNSERILTTNRFNRAETNHLRRDRKLVGARNCSPKSWTVAGLRAMKRGDLEQREDDQDEDEVYLTNPDFQLTKMLI